MALGSWARSKLHSGPACARPALHALSPCFSSACSWARLRPHAGVVPWGSSALDAWVRGVSGANPSLSGRRPELAPHTQLPGADVDSAVRPEWCRMVRLKSWGGRGNRHGQFPNQSLQQMVTVVTVRAKHGPRQPRPLLKHVVRPGHRETDVLAPATGRAGPCFGQMQFAVAVKKGKRGSGCDTLTESCARRLLPPDSHFSHLHNAQGAQVPWQVREQPGEPPRQS